MDNAVSDAIEAIYAAATGPELWPAALQSIAGCFDDVGAVLAIARDEMPVSMIASPSLRLVVEEYGREWSNRDIRVIRGRQRGVFLTRDAVTDRDLLSDAEMATEPHYTNFLAKYDLGYFAGASVSPDPKVDVALSIQRHRHREPYSEAELKIVGLLARHVEQSLRLGIRLLDSEMTAQSLEEALSFSAIGVILLDAAGTVTLCNRAAGDMLGDGLTIDQGRLYATKAESQATLDEGIESATRWDRRAMWSVEPRPMMVERQAAEKPLIVYLLPVINKAGASELPLSGAQIILLLVDPETRAGVDATLIRDVLGLTMGEARVAAKIAEGLAPREIAVAMGLSEHTIRTLLKRVFGKTGVSRQNGLVSLIGALALGNRPSEQQTH